MMLTQALMQAHGMGRRRRREIYLFPLTIFDRYT